MISLTEQRLEKLMNGSWKFGYAKQMNSYAKWRDEQIKKLKEGKK